MIYVRHNSPLEISILLHYHVMCVPWDNVTDLSTDILGMFIREGILEPNDEHGSGFSTTDKGCVFVNMICSTPYPRKAWVHPDTQEVLKVT